MDRSFEIPAYIGLPINVLKYNNYFLNPRDTGDITQGKF